MRNSEELYIPKGLILQWHVTERCNLRCKHCYHTQYNTEELDLDNLVKILEQYVDLIARWRKDKKVGAHINITGGEPLIRKDFFKFLEIISKHKDLFSFAILTNGTLIDKKIARELKKLKPKFIQISIEGKKETHDKIRGDGNYDKAISGLQELISLKVPTFISFTAHKNNYTEFEDVVRLGKRLGVTKVWSDRLLPSGSGELLGTLSPEEACDFVNRMYSLRKKTRNLFKKTEVGMKRALQFHAVGGKPYRCSAGDSLITVQSNGDLYPCRRMPIKVGNLLDKSLSEIYYEDKLLKKLRNKENISEGCEKCFYAKLCNGGLKCLSYAVYKDPFKRDPGCWIDLG